MEKSPDQGDQTETSERIKQEDQKEPSKVKPQDSELRKPDDIILTEEDTQTKISLPADISDPADGDSYDDLDDMLDEFCPVEPKPTTSSASETNPEPVPEDDFAKKLEAEMAELFGNFKPTPEITAGLENVFKELAMTTDKGGDTKSQTLPSGPDKTKVQSGARSPGVRPEENFQDAINKTMERMAASGDQATAAAASESIDSMVTEFLKVMQATDLNGEGAVEEDFSKALLGMMEQLTNKEILYEPMKELDNNFPIWIEEHGAEVEKADLEQYKLQQTCVREIVERFESDKYKDDSVADKEYIVERMQKMQAAGSPPAALVGDLAAAQNALGASEEGCPTQ